MAQDHQCGLGGGAPKRYHKDVKRSWNLVLSVPEN